MKTGKNTKIVFVDDDLFFSNILCQRYKPYPVEFVLIQSVEDLASKKSALGDSKLTITDYSLGSYEGKELIELLQSNGMSNVIVFSGYGHNKQKVESCQSAGASEFVDKSNISRLDEIIFKLCGSDIKTNSE